MKWTAHLFGVLIVGVWVLGWTAGTGFFDYQIVKGLIQQHESAQYATVEGKIISSQVVDNSDSESSSYAAAISYQFTVNGKVYTSDRRTYGMKTSGYGAATSAVRAYPVGATATVYYNAANPSDCVLTPGIDGTTLFGLLFMLPFNLISAGSVFFMFSAFWSNRRDQLAGGVPIRSDGATTRATLSHLSPLTFAFIAVLGASVVLLFMLAFTALSYPAPVWPELLGFVLIGIVGVAAYRYHDAELRSGKVDLIIDARTKTLHLPQTCGRISPMQIRLEDLATIAVQRLEKPHSDGDYTSYSPTIAWSANNTSVRTARLIEWSSQERAEAFTQWLRKAVGSALKQRTADPVEL